MPLRTGFERSKANVLLRGDAIAIQSVAEDSSTFGSALGKDQGQSEVDESAIARVDEY